MKSDLDRLGSHLINIRLGIIIACRINHHHDNNSELYLHDFNNTALQKLGKHDNFCNLNLRVQLQH